MVNVNKVQIYILTAGRLNFLYETLVSVTNQVDFDSFEVIVSDNSNIDDVSEMVTKEFPSIRVIKRNALLSPEQHFKCLYDECSGEYVVFFHDDDLMEKNYCHVMVEYLEHNKDIAAVACDAYLVKDDKVVFNNSLMLGAGNVVKVNGEKSIFRYYLGLNLIRPAPFCSYMYRVKYLKKLLTKLPSSDEYLVAGYQWDGRSELPAGKYSDVVFISKIADLGPVHWLPDKLIKYRLHHDNDSNYSDIHSKLKLLNYYKSKIENDLDVYGFFRYRIWVRWLFSVDSSSCKLFSCKKKRIVWIYIIKRSLLYLLSNPVFLYRVIKKIK